MEAALVSGFIKIIVPRLFSLSCEKYKLSKSVKGNVEFLQHELEMIARTIDDQISRGEHLSSARTQWIQELRQLAYEIEDCIDRYVYRLNNKQIASSVRAGLLFGSEIRGLREKVKEPCERIRRYTSDSQWCATAEPSPPTYDPHTKKADLVGIDKAQEELLELLEEGKGQLKQRKVISIVGFDGLGKTVLAEQVFDSDVAKQFRPRARIVAAEKDAKDVLLSIYSELGLGKELQGNDNVKVLSSNLEEYLHNKRYLIVIDDMRTELWSTIGTAFPANKGLSCRVIVTTPIQSIAYACSSDHRYVYKMRELGEKHSSQLFHRKGPKVELDQTQILKKCDGLPLAIVSIAQFMFKKCVPNGTTTCQDLCNRLGYYLETDKDTLARMQRVLTKNYTSLQGHDLKACMLYLGMFPSEHLIRRKRLIRRWLAEGFVETPDLAVMHFEELMDRNIIKPVDVSHNEQVKTCRTCGMMAEFIVRKSISQDFITMFSNGMAKLFCDQGVQPTGVRRLCLHRMSKSNGSLGDVSLVRSLLIFGEADQNLMELKRCPLLRVLDLEECNDLKDISLKGISNLLLLKYLSLGDTITLIPREITNLDFLQTLSIRRKNVTTLPVEVMLLPSLVHLLGKFKLTGKGKQMIRAEQFLVSGKSKLQTLAGFIVDERQGFAQLMVHMNNLRKAKVWCDSTSSTAGIVHLSKAVQKFIEDDKDEEQANQDNRSLSLHFDQSSSEFLHALEGSCYLSSLKLHGYMGTVLPQFVSLLRGLKDLFLTTSNLTANTIATMSKLRYLQYLKLTADQLEEFVIEAGDFPKLLRLCLVLHRPTISMLEIKEGALPKLVAVQLNFEGLNGPSDINIVHLNSLKEVTLHPDQITKLEEWQKAAKDHPNRPSVELLGTVDQMEIDVMEDATEQDEKSKHEMAVTQRPLQELYSSCSRLKIPHENNDALNCRSEEINEMSFDQECSLNSTDISNVASGAHLTRSTC
ncbi:unnamed protein product [Urochloa decumbens]|uniref:Uncharacterized protein n=1 Tax=Urochloa decumbens TaxID=240449 RepID=A0ABC9ASM4_9POAL